MIPATVEEVEPPTEPSAQLAVDNCTESTRPEIRSANLSPMRPAVLPGRLVSLDAYRGLAMLLMASGGLGITRFVERHGGNTFWKALASQTDHVQWRGCCLWDMIQPSFTFIVGVALPFSLARRRTSGQSFARMTFHAAWRSLLLICLGIFLRSTGKPETNFTFEDTLTQIGLGYTLVFMLAWTRPRTQAIACGMILFGCWLAFALYPLPVTGFDRAAVGVPAPWQTANGLTGFAAHWDKNTNLAATFDQWFLNLFPRSTPFAFNRGGYLTLNFIPTLATMLLGLLAGGLLQSLQSAGRKFLILVGAGAVGLGAGMLLDALGICPIVKRIWTPAWALYSAGWCGLTLAAFYAVVDWAGWKRWTFPLLVVGMNSIAMYCLADGGPGDFIRANLDTNLGRYHVFEKMLGSYPVYAPILKSAVVLLVLWLVCLWMYRRRIFLRI